MENEGYQAERFRASLSSSLERVKLVLFTSIPDLESGSAPEEGSLNSDLSDSRTSDSSPAVLGVANEVPDV